MAEIKHKEGRHVGLDIYDLLIEALYRTFRRAGIKGDMTLIGNGLLGKLADNEG